MLLKFAQLIMTSENQSPVFSDSEACTLSAIGLGPLQYPSTLEKDSFSYTLELIYFIS